MGPRLRTATLTGFAELSRSLGLDPTELAAAVGLPDAALEPSDRWIPAAPVAWLLHLAAERSGVEDFALRLSALRALGTLGPISVVLRDEPDLRSALGVLIRYERAYNEALHLRMTEDDVLVTVSAWLEFGEPAPTAQALDLVMAVLLGVIRALVGSDWQPLSTWFAHAPPADAEPYRRLFGPWVRFGSDFTGLVFHCRDLDLPVVTSDPSLRPYTHEFLTTVIADESSSATAQAAEAVELLLPLGRASEDHVGRRLALTTRQLQRTLAAEGTSFTALVHEVRARLAERYLSADSVTLTEVSRQLGFAAPSAFSRWFRQRFGTAPTEWRRRATTGGAVAQAADRTSESANPVTTSGPVSTPSTS